MALASESWALVETVRFCPPRPLSHRSSSPVQDTGLPCRKHRFKSDTMLQFLLRSCSSTGRVRRFERRGCRFESCQEFHFQISGSDVAGNIRVFQTRFESSNLSFRSKFYARVAKMDKALVCKTSHREFDSHRALQPLTSKPVLCHKY